MGGKKKSLANRLARMSDEERARYLQHKADIEEEAKKRKEQLIAIFMKHKIKKEDGFSRLNLAKINQHWHQILRINKCKEMREDVEHMKKYLDRILEYKNRTIGKLLEELEMAEEQYQHNFQAHFVHIDQMIVTHGKYMASMEEEYQKDLKELLDSGTNERVELIEKSNQHHEHLQTVIYGQQTETSEAAKENRERYLKKKEELTSTFRLQLDSFIKQRENRCAALWRQIATVIKFHVTQTDARRLHLAELKRLDAESADEIANNQERITLQEEEIRILNQQYENLTAKRTETIQNLEKNLKDENAEFLSIRKHFRKELEKDEKQLIFLAHTSNKSIEFLQKLKTKGQQIVNLMLTCRKFETEREQISKWLPLEPATSLSVDESEEEDRIRRKSSAKSEYSGEGAEEMVKKVVISVKSPHGSTSSSSRSEEEDIIKREFALLGNMEQFWVIYNKVDLEFKEMKREKKMLLEQNKYYRGMIRAVLEAAALDQSPESKVSTRVASKKGPRSAPLRRILI